MEQGIISQTTKDRLNGLEQEKADLQNKIAIEKIKAQLLVKRDDIVKYLKKAIKKSESFWLITTPLYRKATLTIQNL